jgi:hypothetical protein
VPAAAGLARGSIDLAPGHEMRSLARNSVIDQQELIEAAQEELLRPEASAKLSRDEKVQLTERILAMGTTWVWRAQQPPPPQLGRRQHEDVARAALAAA